MRVLASRLNNKARGACTLGLSATVQPSACGAALCVRIPILIYWLEHERQSPMKNLEVKFSLSELEFRCKNLFLIWEKHWEARI